MLYFAYEFVFGNLLETRRDSVEKLDQYEEKEKETERHIIVRVRTRIQTVVYFVATSAF